MFANLKIPLSWWDLIKRTFNEVIKDDVPNLAAQQAYYFSIASFFPIENLIGTITQELGRVAPGDAIDIIRKQIEEISKSGTGTILTFGFLLTIWSSSTAMVSLTTTL